jgi:hypothetical protein
MDFNKKMQPDKKVGTETNWMTKDATQEQMDTSLINYHTGPNINEYMDNYAENLSGTRFDSVLKQPRFRNSHKILGDRRHFKQPETEAHLVETISDP